MKDRLSLPILYLSKDINSTKDQYDHYLHLPEDSEDSLKDYLLYMIHGVEWTCEFTLHFIDHFRESMKNCRNFIREKKPKLYSGKLIDDLFFDFHTKNGFLREKLNILRNTAGKYLNELEEIGILSSEQVGK